MKTALHLLFFLLLLPVGLLGQKVFSEGRIAYKVRILDGSKTNTGTLVMYVKTGRIRKELKLDNGFSYLLLIDFNTGKALSFHKVEENNYAIQLNLEDLAASQKAFAGFSLENSRSGSRQIAGFAAASGTVTYRDGSASAIWYTNVWRAERPLMFERFPEAGFLPLAYAFSEKNGPIMELEATAVDTVPVEETLFQTPPGSKMISREEFRQMSR